MRITILNGNPDTDRTGFDDYLEHWTKKLNGNIKKAKGGNGMKWMQFFTPAESLDFKETEKYIAQHPGDEITIKKTKFKKNILFT